MHNRVKGIFLRLLFIPAFFFFSFSQHEFATAAPLWRSGRTAVSDLPDLEKQMLLGAPLSDVLTGGSYGMTSQVWEDALPESFDWRNSEGIDFVTPVKNQGRCGSCVAFAAGSTFNTQMNIATRSPAKSWNFSPQHLFSCGGGSCSTGWFPQSAMDFLSRKGIPEEACYPYVSGATGADFSCKKTCGDAGMRSVRAQLRVRNQPLRAASVDEVKRALLNGPLISTMKVYDDFYSYTGGVYYRQKGAILGGHAVMIIGWNNQDKAWIARNSWGTDWGEQGDFRISWTDPSGVGGSIIGLQPSGEFLGLILEGISDRDALRKPVELTLRSANISPLSAELEVKGNSSFPAATKVFGSNGRMVFDPAEYADGIYTIQARARLADGTQRISQAKLVSIIKGTVTASIKIDRMKAGMNVWETIVPHFIVSSQPVPLARVRYKILNASGGIVRIRYTEHTADRVAMSLNPKGLPAGPYTLLAEAVSDENIVAASDSVTFNIIEK
ncbi:MAG: hypothetical protein EBR09_09065 [Proteobacteria bacterium]|nr:hypothetical protein [Pseudomonadota bacterium]